MAIEWGAVGLAWRAVESGLGALRNTDARKLEPAFDWQYRKEIDRYVCMITFTNVLRFPVKINTLTLRSPAGGALREKYPGVYSTGSDKSFDEQRERFIGPAVTVLEIDERLEPEEATNLNFDFVPPQRWGGGRLRLVLGVAILRSPAKKLQVSAGDKVSK
jgi:hypothetical protein